MKIALPVENDILFEHFGRATEFKIYTVEDFEPLTSVTVHPEDLSHEAVAKFLKEQGVELIICGGIGEGARNAINDEHMILFSGVTGGADDVVQRFLDGNLDYGTDANCDHHDEGMGCGGSCGSCGGCHGCGGHAAEPYYETRTFTDIVHLTKENFEAEVMNDPGLIIIDFWAEWCQPCKMLAPTFEELNGEEPRIKFCKVNVDEEGELAAMFGIDTIPTLAVVQDRHTLTGMVGVHSKQDIRDMLERCTR